MVHHKRFVVCVNDLAVLEPAFEFWCIGLTFLEHHLSWVLFAPLLGCLDKLVVVLVDEVVDVFVASFFGLLLEEHFLPRGIVCNLDNLFALTKRERGSGDVGVLAVGGVLGQDQRTNLDYLISTDDRLHGVAVVEVAVAERVHADLYPGWVPHRGLSADRSGCVADRLPLAKHRSDRALGCACSDLGCGLLVHAKGDISQSTDRLIADHRTSIVCSLDCAVG